MRACRCGFSIVAEDGEKIVHLCALFPLHEAAFDADSKKLRRLLLAGANVNAKDEVNGYTPLHYSSLSHGVGVMSILIDFGANISLLGDDGRSCLHVTAAAGKPDHVRFLLEHGAASVTNIEGKTPLHLVAVEGNEDVARLLLDAGADPNILDKRGCSILHRAAVQGAVGVVRQLLGRDGVEVDGCSEDGMTPLYSACSTGRVDVVRTLLAAASEHGKSEVVKLLIAAGAEIDIPNGWGQTALHVASAEGHLQVVLELLAAGADVLKGDANGIPALFQAAKTGKSDVVRALLEAGADANQAAEDNGETPLMRVGDVACVRMLLDAGAIPHATDADGYNALHCAGLIGSSAGVICSLFKAGCDPTALTEDDETPADVPRDMGNEDAAALLDRLAEEAWKKSSKSSVDGSAGKAMLERETEDRELKLEQEIGTTLDDHGIVRYRKGAKVVKPCGQLWSYNSQEMLGM